MHFGGEKQQLPGTAGSAAARSRPDLGGAVAIPPSLPRRSTPRLPRTQVPSSPPHQAATQHRISLLLEWYRYQLGLFSATYTLKNIWRL